RRLVDQTDPLRPKVLERVGDACDAVTHMMHARPPLTEEPADRRVGSQRTEQLDERFPNGEEHLFDALIVHPLAVYRLDAERAQVAFHGLAEIRDRDPNVVDLR